MTRMDAPDTDRMLEKFLGLLAVDIASHPERLQVVDAVLRARAQSLVEGIDVDLDSPLTEGNE